MSVNEGLIQRISELAGIVDTYEDLTGKTIKTSLPTRKAILSGLGLSLENQSQAEEALHYLEGLKKGLVPKLIPVEAFQKFTLEINGFSGDFRWRITEEDGAVHEEDASSIAKLPPLKLGYHQLVITTEKEEVSSTIISHPKRCWEPDLIAQGNRLWGVMAQVYSLHSERDFGIGDFTNVSDMAVGIGHKGGSFLGLSPLHALFSSDRTKISPYSPSSRLFLDPIFIDPLALEGLSENVATNCLSNDAIQKLKGIKSSVFVPHREVWELKRQLLEAIWSDAKTSLPDDFLSFRKEQGASIEAHATFEAISEYWMENGKAWLGVWPNAFKDIRSDEVLNFKKQNAERIEFHIWLQWIADTQLKLAAEKAKAAGMSVGLYRDLAVGSDGGGSEIWSNPNRFAHTLSVGAPPDPLGPQGQNWGLPPFNPLTLEEEGLAAFRDLVTANMRHAGAIRIDHAFQLQRLFLIPSGMSSSQGAYVKYPFEAMLAVLKLESHRAKCLIIAEDLGTEPEGFSEAIMTSGILSYRVLPFERKQDDSFKRPSDYPRSALAVSSTHDLPTFKGWRQGLDIDLRQTAGIFTPAMSDHERNRRVSELRHFRNALKAENLVLDTAEAEISFEAALHYLARTPSMLVGIQLEDISGELNQANVPGLDASHPNWRRRLSSSVSDLIASSGPMSKVAVIMAEEGRDAEAHARTLMLPPPRATYRLQFHKDFTFDDATRIIPYLSRLGISHVYASPIQTARAGSTHGYDVVDHENINPELGGEEAFIRFSDALSKNGLGLILDIVPNHMGVGEADNHVWLSNLEWGEQSPFAQFFDIDRTRESSTSKLVLPVLGRPYGDALEKGELQFKFDLEKGVFDVWHWEHRFPICPITYMELLPFISLRLPSDADEEHSALRNIINQFQELDSLVGSQLVNKADVLKNALSDSARSYPFIDSAIQDVVEFINGDPGHPESFGLLHELLEKQSYRLAYWRTASSDINYRRFFDILSLGGLRIEDPEVFSHAHKLIFRLISEGRIHGLRIDHIDGLADPAGYAFALQSAIGPGFYIVVEKILERGEALRNWPIAGTSGYDALNWIDGVFVDAAARELFEQVYRVSTDMKDPYPALLRQAKSEILENSFSSEMAALVLDLKKIADRSIRNRDHSRQDLQKALTNIIVSFDTYRSYIVDTPSDEDRDLIETVVGKAKAHSGTLDEPTYDFIASELLNGATDPLSRQFRRRFQQLTGPIMAKSLEDTLFYRYAPLLSLNEVGGAPDHFGVSIAEFHKANEERINHWPNAMVATATHDTKRGEDARARLNALTEMPVLWADSIKQWKSLIGPFQSHEGPDQNDLFILFQALLGAWPVEFMIKAPSAEELSALRERIDTYIIKAMREAKRHTSWLQPNEDYERSMQSVIEALFKEEGKFFQQFAPLAEKITKAGLLSSLSRTILKCTIPGIPDIYQGTEFWDFSLVDPDNRRAVDYGKRQASLEASATPKERLRNIYDGSIKQHLLQRLLRDRATSPELYAKGRYVPLYATGNRENHLIAFARQFEDEHLVVIVSRLSSSFAGDHSLPLGKAWGDTRISIPPGNWADILTDSSISTQGTVTLSDLFKDLPFAVMRMNFSKQ